MFSNKLQLIYLKRLTSNLQAPTSKGIQFSSRICASLRLGLCNEGHRTTTQPSNSGTLPAISINTCNKRQTHNNNFGRNFPGLRVSQLLLLNTTPFLQTFRIVGHYLQFSCPRKCNSHNHQPCHLSLIKSNTCQDSKTSS